MEALSVYAIIILSAMLWVFIDIRDELVRNNRLLERRNSLIERQTQDILKNAQGEESKETPFWFNCATRFDFGEYIIEKMLQLDGSFLWKAGKKSGSMVLNKELYFEFEPQPSSRTDDFIKQCRFATKEEAYEALCNYLNKGEMQ